MGLILDRNSCTDYRLGQPGTCDNHAVLVFFKLRSFFLGLQISSNCSSTILSDVFFIALLTFSAFKCPLVYVYI